MNNNSISYGLNTHVYMWYYSSLSSILNAELFLFFQDQFLLNQTQVSINFNRMGILIDCILWFCFYCLFSFSSRIIEGNNILDCFLYLSSNKSKNNTTPDLILTFKRIQWINYLNTSHHVAYLVLWPSVPTYEAINLETLQ